MSIPRLMKSVNLELGISKMVSILRLTCIYIIKGRVAKAKQMPSGGKRYFQDYSKIISLFRVPVSLSFPRCFGRALTLVEMWILKLVTLKSQRHPN